MDYSADTSDNYVNLASGQATNVGGGIASFQNVIGGDGSDILVGSDHLTALTGDGQKGHHRAHHVYFHI